MDHMAEERKEMKILKDKGNSSSKLSRLKSMHKGKNLGLSKSMSKGCK